MSRLYIYIFIYIYINIYQHHVGSTCESKCLEHIVKDLGFKILRRFITGKEITE